MRAVFMIACLCLGACTQMPANGGSAAAGQAPDGAKQAYFQSYPARLFAAAAFTCNKPGQEVVQPDADKVRCESLPDPESAAAIILQFNGSINDLPRFVISFSGLDTPQGYLVTADSYIRVPSRDGGVQQVRFANASIENELSELLEAAGGRPL